MTRRANYAYNTTMKLPVHLICTVALLFRAFAAMSADQPVEDKKESGRKLSAAPVVRSSLVLDTEEAGKLLQEWKDEAKGTRMVFAASAEQVRLDPVKNRSEYNKFKKSGKIPIRITATLYEMKEQKGKVLSRRLTGTASIYVLDEEQNVVLKESVSLAKMCPS